MSPGGGLVERGRANEPRYRGDGKGHYESYFVRANHPDRPMAFWLRYTIFAPANRPGHTVGELWAAVFHGDPIAIKSTVPIADTSFAGSRAALDVRVGGATLHDDATARRGELRGAITADGHTVAWDLTYAGGGSALLLLPERMYAGGFPKAKALVPAPLANFDGHLAVDGERIGVTGWIGSQNHNWGAKHTDEYAWGQVAGFDGAPDTFLECSTARVRIGGVRTPWLTPVVVRHDGREWHLGALRTAVRATGSYHHTGDVLHWSFRSTGRADGGQPRDRRPGMGRVEVIGEFCAPRASFVKLAYDNPPGGVKTCLNTKVAECRLEIRRAGERRVTLHTTDRAAFEILHG